MISKHDRHTGQQEAAALFEKAGVALSESEIDEIEVADFGLSDFRVEGAQIATFADTQRVGFKVICLLPNQTLPEHWHTAFGDNPGKEETIRVLYGTFRLYLPGGDGPHEGFVPHSKQAMYTCRNEIIMRPTQQQYLPPGTKHWFQAGAEGAVVYSISSQASCPLDPFTDPNIVRVTKICDD